MKPDSVSPRQDRAFIEAREAEAAVTGLARQARLSVDRLGWAPTADLPAEFVAAQLELARLVAGMAAHLERISRCLSSAVAEGLPGDPAASLPGSPLADRRVARVRVCCDVCHHPARDDGREQQWSSRAAAINELSHQLNGWSVSAHHVLCAFCVAAQRCAEEGHDWGAWQDHGLERVGLDPGSLDLDDLYLGPDQEWSVRQCWRCRAEELGWPSSLGPRIQLPRRVQS